MLATERPTAVSSTSSLHRAASVDAIAATLQAGGERAAIVDATGGGRLGAGLRARPLRALISIARLLRVALAVLRVRVQAIAVRGGAGPGPGACTGRAGTVAVASRSVSVRSRRRSRHDVAAGRGVIGVIDIVVVVVRYRVPPVGRAERGQYR